jgi:hypothetical protein
MSEHRVHSRLRFWVHVVPVLITTSLLLSVVSTASGTVAATAFNSQGSSARHGDARPVEPPGRTVTHATPPSLPHATRAKSRAVMSCLRKGRLQHVTTTARSLWVGWEKQVDGFVYVQIYPNVKSAKAEGKLLRKEESGVANRLVISQHIAPYQGSPVPRITKCLGGKMVSKPPKKNGGFHF